MLDVYAARQGYTEQDISNVGFARSNHNIVDGLKKTNLEVSRDVACTGKLSIKVEQKDYTKV